MPMFPLSRLAGQPAALTALQTKQGWVKRPRLFCRCSSSMSRARTHTEQWLQLRLPRVDIWTACNTQASVLLPTPRRQSARMSRPVASLGPAASRLPRSAASSPAGTNATSARHRRLPPTATATSLVAGTDKGPSLAAASRSAGRHKSRPLHPGSQNQPASTSASKMWTAKQRKTADTQRRSTTPPHPQEEGGVPGTPGLTARQGETGRPPEPRSQAGCTASPVTVQLKAAALLKPPGRRQKTATLLLCLVLIQLQTRESRLMPTRLCILRGSRCHAGCTSWDLTRCPRRSEQGLRLLIDCAPLNLKSYLRWWSTAALRPAAVAA